MTIGQKLKREIASLHPLVLKVRRNYVRYGIVALMIVAALFLTLRPAERYVYNGDNSRPDNCIFNGRISDAPTNYSPTLAGYYFLTLSEPIPANDTSRNWGDCPYSKQKFKTYALDLWLVAAAIAFSGRLRSLYRQG